MAVLDLKPGDRIKVCGNWLVPDVDIHLFHWQMLVVSVEHDGPDATVVLEEVPGQRLPHLDPVKLVVPCHADLSQCPRGEIA